MKKTRSLPRDKQIRDVEPSNTSDKPYPPRLVKRQYLRDFSQDKIHKLQERYKRHLKRSRNGFLSTAVRRLLLHYGKWSEDTTSDDVHKFFYDLREHAKAAIDDFRLLSDVLAEEEFRKIFGEKIEGEVETEVRNNQTYTIRHEDKYPISLFFETLIPQTVYLKDGQVINEIKEKQAWRKDVLEDITINSLSWYLNSGIIKTDSHRRTLVDAIDIIGVMSSGKKPFDHRPDQPFARDGLNAW